MIEDGWRFLGVLIGDSDPQLLTALFVVLGYMMAFQLVLYSLAWLWSKVTWLWRKVRPPKKPPPVPVKQYELRYKLNDMRLSWKFETAEERRWFLLGFREGHEYHLESLKQSGDLPPDMMAHFGQVTMPDKKRPTAARNLKIGFFALLFLSAMAFEISNVGEAKADVVKKSSSGICHCPGGSFYGRTTRFTAYKTIDACLSSGGRHPKRGQGDCSKAAPELGGPATIKNKTRRIEGESSPRRPPNATSFPASAETWRGLVVAEENRCSDYRRSAQYPYSPSLEDKIIEAMGGNIYEPYTGRYLASKEDTDIEHIVATAEGHDSGLCAATNAKRVAFATDLLNLTLATPSVNRCTVFGKCAKDAYEWLPPKNKCWFSQRVVDVRKKYGLTIDRREADLLEAVLSHCPSTEMIFH